MGRQRARADVDEDLALCLARGSNHTWHGRRALATLYPAVDPKLVERVMRIVVPATPTACGPLPQQFLPLARALLDKASAKHPHATFLVSYDGDLATGASWLVRTVNLSHETKRATRQLAELVRDRAAVAAARASVVRHGAATETLLSVLAYDGEPESIDALVDVVGTASTKRDKTLDLVARHFMPHVRGAAMRALADDFRAAVADRASSSAAVAFARRFDPRVIEVELSISVDAQQVYRGYSRRGDVYFKLSSRELPHVKVSISKRAYNDVMTCWEDGRRTRDENRLGVPKSIDDIPRWLAASARKLRVTWDRDAVRVHGTLRGKARAGMVAWLLTPP